MNLRRGESQYKPSHSAAAQELFSASFQAHLEDHEVQLLQTASHPQTISIHHRGKRLYIVTPGARAASLNLHAQLQHLNEYEDLRSARTSPPTFDTVQNREGKAKNLLKSLQLSVGCSTERLCVTSKTS